MIRHMNMTLTLTFVLSLFGPSKSRFFMFGVTVTERRVCMLMTVPYWSNMFLRAWGDHRVSASTLTPPFTKRAWCKTDVTSGCFASLANAKLKSQKDKDPLPVFVDTDISTTPVNVCPFPRLTSVSTFFGKKIQLGNSMNGAAKSRPTGNQSKRWWCHVSLAIKLWRIRQTWWWQFNNCRWRHFNCFSFRYFYPKNTSNKLSWSPGSTPTLSFSILLLHRR